MLVTSASVKLVTCGLVCFAAHHMVGDQLAHPVHFNDLYIATVRLYLVTLRFLHSVDEPEVDGGGRFLLA